MDVLYIHKKFGVGTELRYSLRSLRNLPHGRVFIAGELQPWTTDIEFVENAQVHKRHQNALSSLTRALDTDISKDFILMHDDMYVMKPFESLPVFHRGPIRNVIEKLTKKIGRDTYVQRMEKTEEFLKDYGCKNILSYELHTPMVFNKTDLSDTIAKVFELEPDWWEMQYRTIYGNLFDIGGQYWEDPKLDRYTAPAENARFISTGYDTIKKVESLLEARFPDPSGYEK